MFASLARLGELSQPFKRIQSGLFGGKTKQFGNNVPFSKHKTRRSWLPNVQHKRLASDVLETDLRVKVTARALRTIKKAGGLDNYLIQTPAHKLSHQGMRLRITVKDAEKQQKLAYQKSDQGKQELLKERETQPAWRKVYTALFLKTKRISEYLEERTPAAARKARVEAGKAMGLTSPAGPKDTMKYLTQRHRL